MEITLNASKGLLQFAFRRCLVRSIMTSASRCEKILEEMKTKNPYFEKYADKIAKLQQTCPEELLTRLEESQQKREKINPLDDAVKAGKYSQLLNPKESLKHPAQMKEKSLEDVMKLDLIKDKSAEEIKDIWEAYHKERSYIAATIPAKEYAKLQERAEKYPTFLFPLPRSQGYEFIMSQFQNNTVHFTPLLYYQVHKENAPECLTMTYYTEFKDKNIVLMRGEYDTNVIDTKEALCLANQLQLYYSQDNQEKLDLLEIFNNKPDNFKHMDLIKQIENLSL